MTAIQPNKQQNGDKNRKSEIQRKYNILPIDQHMSRMKKKKGGVEILKSRERENETANQSRQSWLKQEDHVRVHVVCPSIEDTPHVGVKSQCSIRPV